MTFFLWTDSSSVQRWCANESLKLETFVANRVTKILECFHPDRLRWVNGKSNPADQLSRGINGEEKVRWRHFVEGPLWLALGEEHWPQVFPPSEEEEKSISVATINVNLQGDQVEVNHMMQELVNKTNCFDNIIRRLRVLRQFGETVLNKVALRKNTPIPYVEGAELQKVV